MPRKAFHRYMDQVTSSYSYIDDALIASENSDEHMEHLRTIFDRFRWYGIIINADKS